MDIFATKGIEYLLVIGYLLVLIPFWWLLHRRAALVPARAPARTARSMWAWFEVPDGLHFHRGHTWAAAEGGDIFRVGMDDFAQRLLGPPAALELPGVGTSVEQGESGWRLDVGGRRLDMLSPLRGEVVEVNGEALRDPALVSEEPYGRGWLLKVRAARPGAAAKNLLTGRLARAWTEQAAERLSAMMGGELGTVLQDGGLPVPGFARQLAGERWPELAAELLLTGDADVA